MEERWSLNELYASFDDQNFQCDIEKLKNILEDMKKYPFLECTYEHLKAYLKQENESEDLLERLFSFVNLHMSVDTHNEEALKYFSLLEGIIASFADSLALIQKWVAKFSF